MSNKENNATVNENAAEMNAQEQTEKKDKKVKEKVTWKLGPISIDLNPTVARILKIGAIGTAVVGVGAVSAKVGGIQVGKKKDVEINSQLAEISRLNALLDAAPKAIECAAEAVTEAVPEVIEAVTE